MKENAVFQTSCFRCVGEVIKCSDCEYKLIKNGRTKGGKQRYYCIGCRTSKVLAPSDIGYGRQYDKQIIQFTKEGLGIRSTSRILEISSATVVRRILKIADAIVPPEFPDVLGKLQVDELHTIIRTKKKELYVIYSWSQKERKVFSMAVGTRSNTNLRAVINPLLQKEVESINTDNYPGYKGVVPKKKHTTVKRKNNGIERQNLNLRTHVKRLNRRTICFSKSEAMLLAVVKIYFWG